MQSILNEKDYGIPKLKTTEKRKLTIDLCG